MNCQQIQEKLSQYLDNRIDDEKRREIEEHLAGCPRCLPEARYLSDGIKGVAGLPEIEPPAGFSARVMTRIRSEKETPTRWARLFQPLWIKIPLHAAGVLLAFGLGVYLFSANEPAQMEIARTAPSKPAPALKQAPASEMKAPEPPKEERAPTAAAPPPPELPPLADSRSDLDQSNRMASLEKEGPAAPAPAARPAEAKVLRPEAGASPEALGQRKSAAPEQGEPDVVLTLQPNGPADKTAALTTRMKQAAERSHGKLFALINEPGQKETKLNFWLNLPPSEYDRFKAELSQFGTVLSESRPGAAAARPGIEPPLSIQVRATFVLENQMENQSDTDSAAPPAPPRK